MTDDEFEKYWFCDDEYWSDISEEDRDHAFICFGEWIKRKHQNVDEIFEFHVLDLFEKNDDKYYDIYNFIKAKQNWEAEWRVYCYWRHSANKKAFLEGIEEIKRKKEAE